MKRRILAVEQSYLIQDIILKAMRFSGDAAEIVPVRSAKEAMENLSVRSAAELPALIILSTELPDTNGYMLARLIKENTATGHIPILMISSRDSEVDIDRAFECGINDYIVKGPEMRYLPDKIQAIFENYERKSEELVLIVDDSVLTLNLIKFALEQRGYKVNTAMEGATAFERATLLGPALIITDLVMPKVDGFDLVKRLRTDESTKHIPVIVLSGMASDKDAKRLKKYNIERILKKPFDNVTLALEVEDMLESRRAADEELPPIQDLENDVQEEAGE